MSVLIKGMEMPTIPQTVIIYPDGTVADVYSGEQYAAAPVPMHGDLIDRDAYQYSGDLMDEPVIIPAEEGYECPY